MIWAFAIVDDDGIHRSDKLYVAGERWIDAVDFARSQLGCDNLKHSTCPAGPPSGYPVSTIRWQGHASITKDNLYKEISHDNGVTWQRM